MDSSSFPEQEGEEDANNKAHSLESIQKSQGKRNASQSKAKPPKSQKRTTETKKPMDPRSWVWEHFTKSEELKDKCNCNYCARLMSCLSTSGTSNLSTHLMTCKAYQACNDKQLNLDQDGRDGNLKTVKVSKEVFREAANEMVVLSELPFAFVESVGFKHFCKKCKLYDPHSRKTAARDIVQFTKVK